MFKPDRVYIEKGFSKFAAATQALFKIIGCVEMLLREYPTTFLAPTTVKKHITGNGRSKKDEVQNVLLEKFPNAKFNNEDESDALGVVVTGLIKDELIKWEIPKKD